MLGVAIVGCGAVSRLHVQSLIGMSGIHLAAVSDLDRERARTFGEEFGVAFYGDVEEMLARNDVDVVSICTPSGLHEEIAVLAANAGKHVIVEKPVEITLKKIDNMITVCVKNNVKLACMFNNRYREGNLFVKRAIDNGRLGRLISVNAFVRWYRDQDYYLKSGWRGTWALDGGGALMNQGIHYVDLMQWFAGDVESVCAYADKLLHKTIETEDTAAAILKFRSGTIGAILAGTSIYPGFPAEIQITGERGSVSIRDGTIGTWSFKDKDALDEEAVFYMGGCVDNGRASSPMEFDCTYHKKQYRHIIDSLNMGTEPEINGTEARKSVEIVLAIYKASAERKEIRLQGE